MVFVRFWYTLRTLSVYRSRLSVYCPYVNWAYYIDTLLCIHERTVTSLILRLTRCLCFRSAIFPPGVPFAAHAFALGSFGVSSAASMDNTLRIYCAMYRRWHSSPVAQNLKSWWLRRRIFVIAVTWLQPAGTVGLPVVIARLRVFSAHDIRDS